MTQSQANLYQVINKIQKAKIQGHKCLAVFDLDSTLFDVSYRTRQIVHEFSADGSLQSEFPESIQILKTMSVHSSDWGLRHSLSRVGLHLHAPEFLLKIRQFWVERFFHADYIKHDQPLPGAANFVKTLAGLGCHIIYLTGRDEKTLREASLESLKYFDFPDAELVLKPNKGSSDSLFKAHWFRNQKLENYNSVFFFENEPKNILEVEKDFPQINIVFIDSTHSGEAEMANHWPTISDFVISDILTPENKSDEPHPNKTKRT